MPDNPTEAGGIGTSRDAFYRQLTRFATASRRRPSNLGTPTVDEESPCPRPSLYPFRATVGETFADFINGKLGDNLNTTTVVMGSLLVLALVAQFAVPAYVPAIYWVTVCS